MFYLANYNKKTILGTVNFPLSKKVNGPFKKDALSYSFIKNELTLRVTK